MFEELLLDVVSSNRANLLAIARRIAGPQEAEEVLHDVIAKALSHQPVHDGKRLLWWLIRVTTNRSIDVAKRKRPLVSGLRPEGKQVWSGSERLPSEVAVIERESFARAADAIGQLTENQKAAFIMREGGSHPHRVISKAMGRTRRQTQRDLEKARAKLYRIAAEDSESLCREAGELMAGYAAGTLDVADRLKAKRHLMHCGACRAHQASFRKLYSDRRRLGLGLILPFGWLHKLTGWASAAAQNIATHMQSATQLAATIGITGISAATFVIASGLEKPAVGPGGASRPQAPISVASTHSYRGTRATSKRSERTGVKVAINGGQASMSVGPPGDTKDGKTKRAHNGPSQSAGANGLPSTGTATSGPSGNNMIPPSERFNSQPINEPETTYFDPPQPRYIEQPGTQAGTPDPVIKHSDKLVWKGTANSYDCPNQPCIINVP